MFVGCWYNDDSILTERALDMINDMINNGFVAAMRLENGAKATAALVWQVCNAADCLRHPEIFPDFPAVPAKKLQFILKMARAFAKHPFAPELARL